MVAFFIRDQCDLRFSGQAIPVSGRRGETYALAAAEAELDAARAERGCSPEISAWAARRSAVISMCRRLGERQSGSADSMTGNRCELPRRVRSCFVVTQPEMVEIVRRDARRGRDQVDRSASCAVCFAQPFDTVSAPNANTVEVLVASHEDTPPAPAPLRESPSCQRHRHVAQQAPPLRPLHRRALEAPREILLRQRQQLDQRRPVDPGARQERLLRRVRGERVPRTNLLGGLPTSALRDLAGDGAQNIAQGKEITGTGVRPADCRTH